jgi:hypothetical protein
MSEQKDRIDETEWDALIILDAGRADVFGNIYDIFDTLGGGDLDVVSNGGMGFTANWMAHHFPDDYDALFSHGGQPIYSMEGGTTWDERAHFHGKIPPYTEYEWDELIGTCWPDEVNDIVRHYADPDDRIVVRYLCPHPPFPGLPELTRGRGNRTRQIAKAVRSGDISVDDVWDAYEQWYLTGLEAADELAEWTNGTVCVTADHGECLGDCGQWFHGPTPGSHEPHDHLTDVPWLVVE